MKNNKTKHKKQQLYLQEIEFVYNYINHFYNLIMGNKTTTNNHIDTKERENIWMMDNF